MILENKIAVSCAIGQAFDYCIAHHHDDFVLFLAHPEYETNWFDTGKTMVLMDSAIDALKDESREKFYIRYLRKNYNKEGFCYEGENGIDDLHIEMMIYTHIWESTYFFKQLLRLVSIISGDGYLWNVNTEGSRHKILKENMIPLLREKELLLGELLDEAYSSYIRDSFAHSVYSVDVDSRKIYLFNASRNNADKGSNTIEFRDFQKKFMISIQLCYWMNHCLEQARTDFAKAGVITHPMSIPDGRQVQVFAKMVGNDDLQRARFEGVILGQNEG